MTATDELRRLLDERGVEWWSEDDQEEPAYYFITKWFANGCEQTYEEIPAIRSRSLKAYCVTPEQAIAATLESGTIEKAAERIEVLSGLAREYLHRYGMLMSMAGEDVTDEVLAIESVINEVCGKKVASE